MFANKLSDLDDFLAPSLECIKPLPNQKKPDLIKSTADKIGQVTLQDCLACSGCVTSAETVLIQQHSVEEFLKLASSQVAIGVSP
jgi:iron only hydrogenase large subunit-like protein